MTVDAVSSGVGAGVSSLTISHVVGVGAKILIVSTAHANNTTPRTVTGITYNGVALTAARQDTNTPGAVQWLNGIWFLVDPPAGTHNIVISLSGSVEGIGARAYSVLGTQQSPQGVDTIGAQASGTSLSTNITPVVPSLLVDCFSITGNLAITSAAGQINDFSQYTGNQISFGSSLKISNGPADTVGWSWSGTQTAIDTIVAFKLAPAGGFFLAAQ